MLLSFLEFGNCCVFDDQAGFARKSLNRVCHEKTIDVWFVFYLTGQTGLFEKGLSLVDVVVAFAQDHIAEGF